MQIEAFLDDYFTALGYRIERLTAHEERIEKKGDRRFYEGVRRILVEYKSGIQTYYTGNVFLETISVDTHNIPGWVYTCQADVIAYAALLNNEILLFRPDDLRRCISDLQRRFRTVKTGKGQNAGYNTHGVIVPLAIAETELAYRIIRL
jgi:hypothetical protein